MWLFVLASTGFIRKESIFLSLSLGPVGASASPLSLVLFRFRDHRYTSYTLAASYLQRDDLLHHRPKQVLIGPQATGAGWIRHAQAFRPVHAQLEAGPVLD